MLVDQIVFTGKCDSKKESNYLDFYIDFYKSCFQMSSICIND